MARSVTALITGMVSAIKFAFLAGLSRNWEQPLTRIANEQCSLVDTLSMYIRIPEPVYWRTDSNLYDHNREVISQHKRNKDIDPDDRLLERGEDSREDE